MKRTTEKWPAHIWKIAKLFTRNKPLPPGIARCENKRTTKALAEVERFQKVSFRTPWKETYGFIFYVLLFTQKFSKKNLKLRNRRQKILAPKNPRSLNYRNNWTWKNNTEFSKNSYDKCFPTISKIKRCHQGSKIISNLGFAFLECLSHESGIFGIHSIGQFSPRYHSAVMAFRKTMYKVWKIFLHLAP